MSYETKVLLIAIAVIISKSKTLEEAYEAVSEMANAQGVIIKTMEERNNQNTRLAKKKDGCRISTMRWA
jgi:hypothetical protein